MKKIRWQIKWYDLDDCESGNAFDELLNPKSKSKQKDEMIEFEKLGFLCINPCQVIIMFIPI